MKIARMIIMAAAAAAAIFSCTREELPYPVSGDVPGALAFSVSPEDYPAGVAALRSAGGASVPAADGYDRVEFAVVSEDGTAVGNLKGFYDRPSSTIKIEGLAAGKYRLLVLGVKGDLQKDDAEIHRIAHESDLWLSFPEDMDRPLSAEYFHSSTQLRTISNIIMSMRC